jgi:hypothetical protein
VIPSYRAENLFPKTFAAQILVELTPFARQDTIEVEEKGLFALANQDGLATLYLHAYEENVWQMRSAQIIVRLKYIF